MWKVLYKGSFAKDSNDHEVSVCRESNRHGMQSWGWGSQDKIVLFSSSIGCNHISPLNEDSERHALAVANCVADALNKEFP